jgi:hypothetical protein
VNHQTISKIVVRRLPCNQLLGGRMLFNKVKKSQWIDIKTLVTWYGIKALGLDGKWYHLAEGGTALVYASESERDDKIKEIKAKSILTVEVQST